MHGLDLFNFHNPFTQLFPPLLPDFPMMGGHGQRFRVTALRDMPSDIHNVRRLKVAAEIKRHNKNTKRLRDAYRTHRGYYASHKMP